VERFLAHAGLAFQSALAQNLLTSKGLILGILLLGLFFLVLRFGLSGDSLLRLVFSLVMVALITVGMHWQEPVRVIYRYVPQDAEEDAAKGAAGRSLLGRVGLGKPVPVNGFFAWTAGLIDTLVNYASQRVSEVVRGEENRVEVSAAFTVALMRSLVDREVRDPELAADIDKFYSFEPRQGCLWLIKEAYARKLAPKDLEDSIYRTMIGELGNAMAGLAAMPTMDGNPYYKAYMDLLKRLCIKEDGKEDPNCPYKRLIDQCIDLPYRIRDQLIAATEERTRDANRQAQGGGLTREERVSLQQRVALNLLVGRAARQLQVTTPPVPEAGGWLAKTLVSVAASLISWWEGFWQKGRALMFLEMFPYFQGFVLGLVYTVFPFYMLAALWPLGGWKALVNYFGMLLWVKSWTFFAVLISGFTDFVSRAAVMLSTFYNSMYEGTSTLDMSLKGLDWFSSVILYAVPLISYFVIFGNLGGLLHLNFQPRATAAAVGFATRLGAFAGLRAAVR
jgi:hypothetical protein